MSNVIKYEFTRVEPKVWCQGNTESHTPNTVCVCVIGLTATEYLADGTTPTGSSAYIDTEVDVDGCPSLSDFTNTVSTLCNQTATANNWKQKLDNQINARKNTPTNPAGWTKPNISFSG